jgi:hypothetical protein
MVRVEEERDLPMGATFSVEDASAYEALDRLLFREWDPIGVRSMDGPEDEYRGYLPEFWRLVTVGVPAESVADYLQRIECDRISIETSPEHRLDIARKAAALLSAWRMPVRV